MPSINDAAIAVLTRHGIEVVLSRRAGCCGSLVHHMGREHDALAAARANIDAWTDEIAAGSLDAILVTASGCGTTVKDYGFMLRADSAYAAKAARVSGLAQDISEYLARLDLQVENETGGLVVAYHSACSLQHGQKIAREPKELLCKTGFLVKDVPEGHLCCGSAGTYNIMQPDIANRLRTRKVGNIEKLAPDVIAAGNIGCICRSRRARRSRWSTWSSWSIGRPEVASPTRWCKRRRCRRREVRCGVGTCWRKALWRPTRRR